ncbi:MAG: hypothetical protein CL681_29410 [Blastopirellula sp.]|nr:hypothetical protein [Blastopirellula sp.]
MYLPSLVLFEFVLTGFGTLMTLWAIVDMRRGFNFADIPVYVQGRPTDVLSRNDAPIEFWYRVLLKLAFGALLYGNAVYAAVLWLPG